MGDERQRQAAALKAQQIAEEKQVTFAALNGDPEARRRLAYYNSELYLKLDENHKKAVDQAMKAIGQQAFSILQLPEDQRAPALRQAIVGLRQQGVDTSGFQLSGDATADLKAALAMTGQLDQWEQFSQPKYQQVGEAGLAGFQFGVPIQQNGQVQNFAPGSGQMPVVSDEQSYAAIPPGQQYTDPNGNVRVKPGGPTQPASGSFLP